ncbi:hypothetical protein DPMN_079005 [Dreissena polymorpha]|uniref:Uncharacterized protein n=1 Tax=Dreissena polymorpha TaxID=45954 RepID=A0A9D4BQR0_DREPO|nr:hypothetical protein DPMN_079005 [Dreissena polymorpha]
MSEDAKDDINKNNVKSTTPPIRMFSPGQFGINSSTSRRLVSSMSVPSSMTLSNNSMSGTDNLFLSGSRGNNLIQHIDLVLSQL